MIEEVTIEELVTLISTVARQKVTILKDDGCNTDDLSKDLVRRHRKFLKVKTVPMTIKQSNVQNTENSEEVVLDTEIEIRDHLYVSK